MKFVETQLVISVAIKHSEPLSRNFPVLFEGDIAP